MDANAILIPALSLLIPILGVLMIPVALYIWLRHAARRQEEIQKTLRAMIDAGQTISPELLEQLALTTTAHPGNPRHKDLRWGVILCALGLGWILFGIFSEGFGPRASLEDVMESAAWGSVFIMIGLARLALWKFMPRSETP